MPAGRVSSLFNDPIQTGQERQARQECKPISSLSKDFTQLAINTSERAFQNAQYFIGGKKTSPMTVSANTVVYLINCIVESILFVDKDGNPAQGRIIMNENSKVRDLENTNAEITLEENILMS